ncbi:MAG: hypothetical protein ABIA63_04710, partial [bacterium]
MKKSVDTLIIMPLRKECNALIRCFSLPGYEYEIIRLKVFGVYFPRLSAMIALGGHGKAQFGITTQYLINEFS